MKPILLAAALIFVASANLHATDSLIFDSGGYNIQILVGNTDKPAIAEVRFTPPKANNWLNVPRDVLRVEKFDMKKQVLIMHFSNPKNDPQMPHSFSLSVKKENAVLSIDGKKIKSAFSWEM